MLKKWANSSKGSVSSLLIPNVFGPFGKPFYNSVIATFSHQLVSKEKTQIIQDNYLNLIYVGELIEIIINIIKERSKKALLIDSFSKILVPETKKIKVSDILKKLKTFSSLYYKKGIIPDLSNTFDKNLFITFFSFIDHEKWFPFNLEINSDSRGSFVETMKFNSSGQVSFSTTKPGVVRGNHFHTRKFERFAVIDGKALIQLRKIGTNEKYNFILNGESPSFVDMPVWFTHNIKNIGTNDLLTLFGSMKSMIKMIQIHFLKRFESG